MCARPYRLNLGNSTTIFEVDDSSILTAKRQVLNDAGLEPRVKVLVIEGDATHMKQLGESLIQHGFDPSVPTDWILGGLLSNIDPVHHKQVFEGVKEFGGVEGSRTVFTTCEPFCHDYVGKIMGVNFPWAKLRPIDDIVKESMGAGWSKDVVVLRDEDFMQMFQRSIGLPIPLVMAEAIIGEGSDSP